VSAATMLILILFAAIWVGGLVVWILGARAQGTRRRQMPWYVRLWIVVTAMFILGVGGYALLATLAARVHLQQLAEAPHTVVRLQAGSESLSLNDAADASRFLQLLCDGESVSAHHSHPVDTIKIIVEPQGEVYKLGRDSAHLQEFWLEEGSGQHIRQFHSPALDVWLRTHGPASSVSTPATAPTRKQ
jgi:hypothetical protein